jgi:hypothetical protein
VKVGGGLNYVTGPMGSGKSLYAVRRLVEALTTGCYAITNVELLPGWDEQIAAHIGRFSTSKTRARIAARARAHYVFETELQEARRYRVPGSGEGRAIFVWDEGHNDLNNRNWKESGRDELLKWATQLRKLGFTGYLLSQHADNTDAALRRVANYHVRLQNQREQTRVLGMRVTPWPLFLAYWYPAHIGLAGSKIQPVRIERYFLDWRRNLYDTHGLYHGLDTDDHAADAPIHLPPGGRTLTGQGRAAGGSEKGPASRPERIELSPRSHVQPDGHALSEEGVGLAAASPRSRSRRRAPVASLAALGRSTSGAGVTVSSVLKTRTAPVLREPLTPDQEVQTPCQANTP